MYHWGVTDVLAWQINQHLLTGTPVYSTFAINFENQILGWMQCYVIEFLVIFTCYFMKNEPQKQHKTTGE